MQNHLTIVRANCPPIRTLSLDQVETMAAERYAAANSPAAVATRAIETLVAALADCTPRECGDLLTLLRDEIPDRALWCGGNGNDF